MKIKIERKELLDGLQKISNIIGAGTLPVLNNALFETKTDKVELTTTDLGIYMRVSLPCEVIEEGKTTIPCKKLLGFVSKVANDEVTINEDNNSAKVSCGRAKFNLICIEDKEFPYAKDIVDGTSIELEQGDVIESLKKVSYATSKDETRRSLTGVYLSIAGKTLTAVGTDGKRLAIYEKDIETDSEMETILPSKLSNELRRVLGGDSKVKVSLNDVSVSFETGDIFVLSNLITGETFPNFKQIIPDSIEKTAKINTKAFISAIDIVSLAFSDTTSAISMDFKDNELTLKGQASNVGEADQTIDIEYGGEEISISINPYFVLDALKNIDEKEISFGMNEKTKPIVMVIDNFRYIVMPVRS